MNVAYFISALQSSGEQLEIFLKNIPSEQATWKPHPEKWSVLEVVNHLYDEEKEDFRKRLELTLFHPGVLWPENDPEGWVTQKAYNKRKYSQSINNFLSERQISLKWLKKSMNADFNTYYEHPKIGKLSAGDLLVSWLCHDYIHLRQLVNLRIHYLDILSKPYSTRYASP